MGARDAIGVVICAAGIAISGVGNKLLGGMWIWFGVGTLAVGCGVLAFSARARHIEKRLREYRGPGDWGQRDYSGGASAADAFGSSHGVGGDHGGGNGGGGNGGGGK